MILIFFLCHIFKQLHRDICASISLTYWHITNIYKKWHHSVKKVYTIWFCWCTLTLKSILCTMNVTMHETNRKDGKLTGVTCKRNSITEVKEGRLLLLPVPLESFMITWYFKNLQKSVIGELKKRKIAVRINIFMTTQYTRGSFRIKIYFLT